MGELSWNTLKQMVYERAHGCCEYCQTCEAHSGQTMQVDHNRDREEPRGFPPPTPPGIRVRTMAVRCGYMR
jgi:hypothetical protein